MHRPATGHVDRPAHAHRIRAYGGVNAVTVRETQPIVFTAVSTVEKKKKPLQLFAMSEVLDFDVFPSTEHTGVAIRD